ncbi:MAG: protease, partial [Bacteroidetes bacterium]|nr:protease [Bacteroidota bacterium]
MRKHSFNALLCLAAGIAVATVSCKKDNVSSTKPDAIPTETLAKIEALGFSSADVHKFGDDYIVEGDIRLTEADLNSKYTGPVLRVASSEQYRTTNLVTGTPRTITIKV